MTCASRFITFLLVAMPIGLTTHFMPAGLAGLSWIGIMCVLQIAIFLGLAFVETSYVWNCIYVLEFWLTLWAVGCVFSPGTETSIREMRVTLVMILIGLILHVAIQVGAVKVIAVFRK